MVATGSLGSGESQREREGLRGGAGPNGDTWGGEQSQPTYRSVPHVVAVGSMVAGGIR